MTSRKVAGLLAGILLFAPALVRAQDSEPSKFHFSAGVKLWSTHWSTWDGDGQGNLFSISDSAGTLVPNFSLRYGNWMVAGSAVSTGTFKFPTYHNYYQYFPNTDDYNYRAKRTEWDINAGYLFNTSPGTSLGVTLGYKQVTQKFHVVNIYNGVQFGPESRFDFLSSGPVFGITGSAAIGHGLALYGNGAGSMWMKMKSKSYLTTGGTVTSGSNFKSGVYESAELGLAWRKEWVQLSFGYRYQVLETKFKSSDNLGEDVTRGYTFGFTFVH